MTTTENNLNPFPEGIPRIGKGGELPTQRNVLARAALVTRMALWEVRRYCAGTLAEMNLETAHATRVLERGTFLDFRNLPVGALHEVAVREFGMLLREGWEARP